MLARRWGLHWTLYDQDRCQTPFVMEQLHRVWVLWYHDDHRHTRMTEITSKCLKLKAPTHVIDIYTCTIIHNHACNTMWFLRFIHFSLHILVFYACYWSCGCFSHKLWQCPILTIKYMQLTSPFLSLSLLLKPNPHLKASLVRIICSLSIHYWGL